MGVEANVLDCGRFFFGGVHFNDNADGLGSIVQRGGSWCWSGWREVGNDTRSKENGQEIWGENGSDGGWPLPSNKKKLKKGRALGLYLMELMLLSMGSSMGAQRLLLCRSPLASIRSVHTSAQGDLRQTLNSLQ